MLRGFLGNPCILVRRLPPPHTPLNVGAIHESPTCDQRSPLRNNASPRRVDVGIAPYKKLASTVGRGAPTPPPKCGTGSPFPTGESPYTRTIVGRPLAAASRRPYKKTVYSTSCCSNAIHSTQTLLYEKLNIFRPEMLDKGFFRVYY